MDWRQLEVERDLSQTIVHVDMDGNREAIKNNKSIIVNDMSIGNN
jgi:hypothetical protein